jgi:methyl-accepting chemotaxis protein
MKKNHMSLSVQVLILCLGLVLVISATVTTLFYININRIAEDHIREKSRLTMQFLESNLSGSLTPFIDLVESGAAYINALPSQKTINDVFTSIIDVYPSLLDIYYGTVISMYAPGGMWICGTGWYPETDPEWDYEWDPPKRYWHQTAIANPDKIMLVEPYVDADTGKVVVTFSRTVRNESRAITGVIAVDVTLDNFADIVTNDRITEDGTTVLVEKNGLFIVHADHSYVLEKNIFDEMPAINKEVLLSDRINVIFQGNNYICSAPVKGTDWYLISTGSLTSMRMESRMILWTVLIVVFILAMGSAGIAIALSYSLAKPFRHLISSFSTISGGDFTASPPDYASLEASAL